MPVDDRRTDAIAAAPHERLALALDALGPCAIAVSGGVDSLTLATFAARLGLDAVMVHAVSPAVPSAATARVRERAAADGWSLRVVDAGEFADERYLANPANRCFHCKSSLYGTMARLAGARALLSGTNTDDLGDWRPGLEAAAARGVHHPYVEADMDKAAVRALADALGLPEVAAMPASPCLSSRVETGLRIDATELALIDRVETALRELLPGIDLRCRRRAGGREVEIAGEALDALDAAARERIADAILRVAGRDLPLVPYRRGSAFLRDRPDRDA